MSSVEEVYGISQKGDEGGDNPTLKDIDIITLAPELPGASDAVRSLTKNPNQSTSEADRINDPHSVVVSCGHTEATYEDGITAISCGASLLTHLYNAMNPFHHRKPGLVGLLSSEAKLDKMGLKRPFFSMIVDGIHVHESAVCMAYQSHPHGCVLVTDAMAAMGLGNGEHLLGNMKVTITGDRATLAGKDVLAGSVVSMDTCVKRFHRFTGCSVGEALLCATLHPAMVLKRHEARYQSEAPIGILELGAKADLVLLNDDLDVLRTWVAGRVAFQSKNVQNNI
jgi:N-acetylglucosamine-6-phosphate deacetylase